MSINSITFIGSVNTSYRRGKDKTKRKSRRLLAVGGLGLLGAKIGGNLAEESIFQRAIIKSNLKSETAKKYLKNAKLAKKNIDMFNSSGFRKYKETSSYVRRGLKLLNVSKKAKIYGGLKGAVIGAGLGLGSIFLSNKLKNKDKN